jgi:hypothetical protein
MDRNTSGSIDAVNVQSLDLVGWGRGQEIELPKAGSPGRVVFAQGTSTMNGSAFSQGRGTKRRQAQAGTH